MSKYQTDSRRDLVFEIVKLTAILVTCGFLVWANLKAPSRVVSLPSAPTPATPVPEMPLSIEAAALRGAATAPVVLVEWSDYECPYCEKADNVIIPEIDRLYIKTGRVQLAFFHRPLSRHPNAKRASEVAVCAAKQGKFWEMHAALFADYRKLDEASLFDRARALGLDQAALNVCLTGPASLKVQADIEQAENFKLKSTPAFFVGVRQPDGRVKVTAVIEGAKPVRHFATQIDLALDQAKTENVANK